MDKSRQPSTLDSVIDSIILLINPFLVFERGRA